MRYPYIVHIHLSTSEIQPIVLPKKDLEEVIFPSELGEVELFLNTGDRYLSLGRTTAGHLIFPSPETKTLNGLEYPSSGIRVHLSGITHPSGVAYPSRDSGVVYPSRPTFPVLFWFKD